MFQGNFKKGCFNEQCRMFQGRQMCLSIEFQGIPKSFKKTLKGCFKEVSKVFHGNFHGISMKFQRVFLKVSGGVLRVLQRNFRDFKRM